MTFHINPDRIENNDVEIITNADGDTAITDKASGETVTLGSTGFTAGSVGVDELSLTAQDLSTVSGVDGHIYNHDGSSSITADGATTSAVGHYVWSATDSEWKAVVQY